MVSLVSSTVIRPELASTKSRVTVAIPHNRCRKFNAVRSAVSNAAAPPRSRASSVPDSQRSPSRRAASSSTCGSSCRKHSIATSRPASTHDVLTTITPVAVSSAGTTASVVTSPQRTSSASARRTISR